MGERAGEREREREVNRKKKKRDNISELTLCGDGRQGKDINSLTSQAGVSSRNDLSVFSYIEVEKIAFVLNNFIVFFFFHALITHSVQVLVEFTIHKYPEACLSS